MLASSCRLQGDETRNTECRRGATCGLWHGTGWAGTAASFMFQDSTQVKLKVGSTQGESGVDNCHVTTLGHTETDEYHAHVICVHGCRSRCRGGGSRVSTHDCRVWYTHS